MIAPIVISAFKDSPDRGTGQARDMRVRWALEEAGLAYDVELFTFDELKQPAYRACQPFGQIPFYREGDLTLFESGSIVFHAAECGGTLLPDDPAARARAITWMFAALNTVEPPIVELEGFMLTENDKPWYAERLPLVEDKVHARLRDLSARLGEAEWLEDAFSAGDLMMIEVLLRLQDTDHLARYPNLTAYVARGEARPAFKRAYAAQHAVFVASQHQTAMQGA